MRTLEEVKNQFAYHPATKETAAVHDELRNLFMGFAECIWPIVPEGPEKTLVMRNLQQALMYANLSVALQAPADTKTADVARVLPT